MVIGVLSFAQHLLFIAGAAGVRLAKGLWLRVYLCIHLGSQACIVGVRNG